MQQPSQATDAMMTLRRLRRETAQLEHADDWTVLGIPRTKDLERIELSRQRMADRYAHIAEHDGYSEEIHDMARAIARQVDEAAAKLSQRVSRALEDAVAPLDEGPQEPDAYAANPEDFADQFFLRGQAALAAGDAHTAINHLRKARNEHLDSARNMAWLGWAFYQDQARPAAERRAQAMELLELADQFDPEFLDGQFFLATVEADGKLHKRAAARLRRLLKTKSDHLGARQLYERVQSALAAQGSAPSE
jgi:tetratricopeptide (TPR) repeat protein